MLLKHLYRKFHIYTSSASLGERLDKKKKFKRVLIIAMWVHSKGVCHHLHNNVIYLGIVSCAPYPLVYGHKGSRQKKKKSALM